MDEKSQIQASGPGPHRTGPADATATPERRTRDYVRPSTTSLFAAYGTASGSVIAQHYQRHRHQEFLPFLMLVD